MVTGDARSVSTWNREKGLPLTQLETAILLTTNWTVIVVMSSTCYPVRFVKRSTLGQQQQNKGLGLTIKKARFRAHSRLSFEGRNRDDLVYRHFSDPGRHSIEDVSIQCPGKNQLSGQRRSMGLSRFELYSASGLEKGD